MAESAEMIADVVADIRAGRVWHPAALDEPGLNTSLRLLAQAQQPQPVVDCTAIFRECQRRDEIHLYDDHPQITPPWEDALLCYVNTHGNVLVLHVHREEWDGRTPAREWWFTENEVDWSRVRWIAETAIWVGGSSHGKSLPTAGPCHMFRHAIRDDGSPEDINWVALMARIDDRAASDVLHSEGVVYPLSAEAHRGIPTNRIDGDTWEAPLITVGAALNFLNATNVDVAEPSRPRPVRRRLAATGVTVQTIVVRPPGRRRAKTGAARPIDATESVLSPVRGHWARYGPAFDRGLLFGKYAGKFWIAGHIRGAGEAEPVRDYVLQPAPSIPSDPGSVA